MICKRKCRSIVCKTDKSAKLAVLSRERYLSSGLVHCNKDLEVNITEVTRLQKFVNSHVNWVHEILGTGEYWNHSERIKHSSSDEASK